MEGQRSKVKGQRSQVKGQRPKSKVQSSRPVSISTPRLRPKPLAKASACSSHSAIQPTQPNPRKSASPSLQPQPQPLPQPEPEPEPVSEPASVPAKVRTTFILFGANKEWPNRSAKTEAAARQCTTTRLSGRAPREDWRKRLSTWSRASSVQHCPSHLQGNSRELASATCLGRSAPSSPRVCTAWLAPAQGACFLVSSGLRDTAPPTSAVCGCASPRSTGDTSAT